MYFTFIFVLVEAASFPLGNRNGSGQEAKGEERKKNSKSQRARQGKLTQMYKNKDKLAKSKGSKRLYNKTKHLLLKIRKRQSTFKLIIRVYVQEN